MNPKAKVSRGAEFGRFVQEEFLPYQWKWINDNARFKIGLWARQTGKDLASAAEAVFDCLERPKTLWAIVAAGERQALESLRKARDWAISMSCAIENYEEVRRSDGSLLHAAEITWQNG